MTLQKKLIITGSILTITIIFLVLAPLTVVTYLV